MSAVFSLKTALISTVLAASAFSGAAYAQEAERGPDGMFKEPSCDYDFTIKRSLEKIGKKIPTGIKASNDKWDMEIYANPTNGAWTLVGKSKTSKTSDLCKLASGTSSPYTQEKWFTSYFGTAAPRIAGVPQDPKPNLN